MFCVLELEVGLSAKLNQNALWIFSTLN
jgi:hypothetical protein